MSALQKGEKVVVTGGTGWIGSHIANEALAAGLKIRLVVRSEEKAKDLLRALEKEQGSSSTSSIETVVVKDFTKPGAFDEATKGDVAGVVHCASDVSFSDDPKQVVDATVQAYKNILESSSKNAAIRRFVLTSSSVAVGSPNAGGKETVHFDDKTWNDAAVEAVKKGEKNPGAVYSASKVLSERVAWDFVKEKKPSFIVTAINPNANFGRPLTGLQPQSTGGWLQDLAEGRDSLLEVLGPQYHIDVEDVAKLHIIALIREDVKSERILAFATKYNMNSLIDAIKKVKPDAKTKEKKPEWGVNDNSTVDNRRANELLKDQGGLRDLEYSVSKNLVY